MFFRKMCLIFLTITILSSTSFWVHSFKYKGAFRAILNTLKYIFLPLKGTYYALLLYIKI